MFGIILSSLGALWEEVGLSIGKTKVAARQESIYTMAFLDMMWGVVIFLVMVAWTKGKIFTFTVASLPTFGLRTVLELILAEITVRAITTASRSTFGFLRTLTIPLLLGIDIVLGYVIGPWQIVGMALVVLTIVWLSYSHGLERRGMGLVLGTAVLAAVTLSLYKYDITHFNSVVGEQLVLMAILVLYFWGKARFVAGESPEKFLRQPVFLLQSASAGVASLLGSFAFVFAPASVILAAKRSSAVLWALLSGRRYFQEQRFAAKLLGFFFLAAGLVLLALNSS